MANKSQHSRNEKKKPQLTLKERRAKKLEKKQQKSGSYHHVDEPVIEQ